MEQDVCELAYLEKPYNYSCCKRIAHVGDLHDELGLLRKTIPRTPVQAHLTVQQHTSNTQMFALSEHVYTTLLRRNTFTQLCYTKFDPWGKNLSYLATKLVKQMADVIEWSLYTIGVSCEYIE